MIKSQPIDDDDGQGVYPDHGEQAVHANVDRATLRQILLAGLEDFVHIGKALDRYDSDGEGVTAFFADGSSARGDVLVGADGIRSAVRRQRASRAATIDAGITAIDVHIPLADTEATVPAEISKTSSRSLPATEGCSSA